MSEKPIHLLNTVTQINNRSVFMVDDFSGGVYTSKKIKLQSIRYPIVNLLDFLPEDYQEGDDIAEGFTQAVLTCMNGARLYIPEGTHTTNSGLVVNKPITVFGSGEGSVIHNPGNYRTLTVEDTRGVYVHDLKFTFVDGSTNQVGLRFFEAEDCYYSNIIIVNPYLNGVEVHTCSRVHGKNVKVLETRGAFGILYYNAESCTDTDFYLYQTKSWAHQFKSSENCVSYGLRVVRPQTNYAIYMWTGFSSFTVPGPRPCYNCGYVDFVIEGGTTEILLVYFNAVKNCYLKRGKIIQHPDTAFTPVSIAGSSFYNNKEEMVGTTEEGSVYVINVTNIQQLTVGEQIKFAGDFTTYTIKEITEETNTIELTFAAAETLENALIGWAIYCEDVLVEDVEIVGNGIEQNTDMISVSGEQYRQATATLKNVVVRNACRNAVNVNYANVTILGGNFEYSNQKGWNISHGNVYAFGSTIKNLEDNLDSYGIYVIDGSSIRAENVIIDGCGVSCISAIAEGDEVTFIGGELKNGYTAAAIVRGNSILQGVKIKDTRDGVAGFNGEIRVFGSFNTIIGCVFIPAAGSTADCHISEQEGATNNTYVGNCFHSNFTNKIKFADGSQSSSYHKRYVPGTAEPTAGTWAVGDKVYRNPPVSGSNEGWICVTAGTPGTWKTYGSVS